MGRDIQNVWILVEGRTFARILGVYATFEDAAKEREIMRIYYNEVRIVVRAVR